MIHLACPSLSVKVPLQNLAIDYSLKQCHIHQQRVCGETDFALVAILDDDGTDGYKYDKAQAQLRMPAWEMRDHLADRPASEALWTAL